ncbi:MAG: hypothetical protein ACRDFS_04155 [Chloroflexota bacterium]
MTPMYTIMESPHRWLILAGLSLGTAILFGMAFIAWLVPIILVRVWLLAGIAATLYFLVRALLEWKLNVEDELDRLSEKHEA